MINYTGNNKGNNIFALTNELNNQIIMVKGNSIIKNNESKKNNIYESH